MSENKGQIERLNAYSRLIEMQCGKAVRPYRADGYINMLNRYGTSKDTTEQYRFKAEPQIPDDLLTTFYEGNGLFARIIDTPAEEAVKHGFSLKDLKDQKIEDFYSEALDELDWEETAMTALKWSRLFGGSIAVMLIDDGGTLDQPLNWRNIKSIDDIRVFDRSRIQPDTSSMFHWSPHDPFRTRGSRLGMPEYYDVFSKYGNFRVHDSRCLVFQNGILPENTTNSIYQMWGMPEYIRIHRAIRDAELAHGNAVKMLDRAIQAVYKMKDLSALLATEQGEGQVLRRLQTIDMARGLLNSITIDTEGEDYDFRTFQLSGVNEVIDAACNYLSALTSIPQAILFGRQPVANNDGGHSDFENYYNYVERIQKRMLRSNLRYLLSVIFQAGIRTGEVDEIPKIKVEFNPLWSRSDMEEADLELKKVQTQQAKAQTVQIYYSMQAIDSTEVRKNLADSKEFDIENMLDEYEDEELFPPEMMGGDPNMGNPGTAPSGSAGTMPGQEDPTQYSQKPSVEAHNGVPGDTGNAPAAAPAATKLPEDKAPLEVATEAAIDQTLDETKVINQDEKPQSVGVLVVSDGKILSGTRHNDFGYGLVCGPGGHVEPGETPEEAAFRETEEEFGIKPLSLMYLGKGKKEPDTGLTPDLFLCTEYEGEVNCQDLEMTGAKFRTLEELDELAASMFQPFADGLEVLMMCLETCMFFSDEEEGITRDKLAETIGEAMQDTPEKEDGGPGSGNHGHKGVPGQVGGSAPGKANSFSARNLRVRIGSMSSDEKEDFAGDWLGYSGREIRKAVKSNTLDDLIQSSLDKVDQERASIAASVKHNEKQEKAIRDVKKKLVSLEVEHSYSFAEDGRVLEHVTGDLNSAEITKQDISYVTVHNHPDSDFTFSPPDIEAFADADNMSSMTVYGKNSKYVMSKGEGATSERIKDMMYDYQGLYGTRRDKPNGNDDLTQWMYLNAHKYGVVYTEERLDATDGDNTDGGPGSGNWGHEGRPGKIGGSAEGGGSHNRMGNKKEGFTSFSKNKKKFAAPHKADWDEFENCPTGSILIDSQGKWKKDKDNEWFINTETGEVKHYWNMALDNEDKEVRLLVPDESNPNFKKMKVRDDERFSKARKEKAFHTSEPADADKLLREQTAKVWQDLDEESRYALNAYTYMAYMDINPALRGTDTPSEKTKEQISRITKAIDKCELQQDTYLYRGVDRFALSKMLGVTYERLTNGDPGKFVGMEITDKAFMSCGTAEGKGFDGSGVYMKIYCPQGTKAMYAEPFSAYGSGDKGDWDGYSEQTSFSTEFETILQRGTRMQITGAKKTEYGSYEIECQVLAQEYE